MRAALQLALDALESLFGIPDANTGAGGGGVVVWRLGGSDLPRQAIVAIKQALAQPDNGTHTVRTPAHTDHPLRHYDRTCPACIKGQA